jgi:hypothetical protein
MAAVWAVGLASPFSLPPKSFLRGSDLSVCGNKLMNMAAPGNFSTNCRAINWAESPVFALERCVDAMLHRERDLAVN